MNTAEKNTLTPPYINLNGNSFEDIRKQFITISKVLGEAADTIQRSDYSNARNATDHEHAEKLRSEKNAILKSLKEFRESYINSFKEINKKRINNF
jgi:hypothetical protein